MGVIGNVYRFVAYGPACGYMIASGYHTKMTHTISQLTGGGLDSLVQQAHNASGGMVDWGKVIEMLPVYISAIVATNVGARIANKFTISK